MTARIYDIYDLSSAFVEPTATAAAKASQARTAQRGADRLMRGSAYLLTFAGALFLAALIVAATPLSTVDVDLTAPFVVVVLGALAAIGVGVVQA